MEIEISFKNSFLIFWITKREITSDHLLLMTSAQVPSETHWRDIWLATQWNENSLSGSWLRYKPTSQKTRMTDHFICYERRNIARWWITFFRRPKSISNYLDYHNISFFSIFISVGNKLAHSQLECLATTLKIRTRHKY